MLSCYDGILSRLVEIKILVNWGMVHCPTVIDFFNKDPIKNIYLVIIYKKTWYFSESKTIDVHCRGAKMFFPIFSDIIFWEACAKNVKYYKL